MQGIAGVRANNSGSYINKDRGREKEDNPNSLFLLFLDRSRTP